MKALARIAACHHHSAMPRRSRHRQNLPRLVRGVGVAWLARALALILVLGNAFAAVAPIRMLAMASPAVVHASHAAMGAMAGSASESTAGLDSAVAMPQHHHHHAAADSTDESSANDPAQHGKGCPCCTGGQCGCAQTCSPLPMIAALLPASSRLAAGAPMAPRVAPPVSIRGVPPLRPPIA